MRWQALVPPGVSFLALAACLVAARFYEMLPIKPAPCGLRTFYGIPCLACGGTRSLSALSHGEIIEAAAFNPLVFLAAVAIVAWLAVTLARIFGWVTSGRMPRWTRAKIALLVAGSILLAVANWTYLIWFLPE